MNGTLTKNRKLKHINLYLVNRAYGGAEEGGWWYDTGMFVSCLGKSLDPVAANVIQNAHAGRLEELNAGRPSISSVRSTGRYEIVVEPRAGESYPNYRPQYE